MLVRDRVRQAQDRPAAVADLPRHLPQGHHVQLPVHGPARPADPARVQRLRPLLWRATVSFLLSFMDQLFKLHLQVDVFF